MIKLRRICKEDCDLLFNWCNDKLVRKNSFNTKYITYEEHSKWFSRIINSRDVLAYIMELNKTAVGQIRIKIIKDEAIISYSISKEYRGKKLGYKIIKLIELEICKIKNIKKIIAYVKKDNLSSRKIFKRLNYKENVLNNEFLYFKLI